MKQTLQLRIQEPCHENWNEMAATEQGRFCMSCKKAVIDFSGMTDKEILHSISTAGSGICGRVGNGQLNRNLVNPAGTRKMGWRHWMGMAASLVLLSSRSNAQVKPPYYFSAAKIYKE